MREDRESGSKSLSSLVCLEKILRMLSRVASAGLGAAAGGSVGGPRTWRSRASAAYAVRVRSMMRIDLFSFLFPALRAWLRLHWGWFWEHPDLLNH